MAQQPNPASDSTPTAATPAKRSARPRLAERRFTKPGMHPYEAVEWQIRDARIGKDDRIVFEQLGIEFPMSWSQNATNIVAQKYFAGKMGAPDRESSVKHLLDRVVGKITREGHANGYFADAAERDTFEAELTHILLHQMASFNSPVWFNIGREGRPQQASACFILDVKDSMEDILEWYKEEGIIFKGGSGAGVNLSKLRASAESLSGGGASSGPVTFMRGADASAGTIKSGGTTRRAAKMVILDVNHPDIEEFIWCKAVEERKARALAEAGFDMSLNTVEGEKNWASLQYQNANNSIRVDDEFMRAVEADEEYCLIARNNGDVVKTVRARDLMGQIAQAAWECADPGVQYDTTFNKWHTSPHLGRIEGTNPCSEYASVSNSACNLASLNLLKFLTEDGEFLVDDFKHAVQIIFLAQEILIGFADYPTEAIAKNTRMLRQIGIGYSNLGALLMALGLPYDSDEGRSAAAAVTALMTGASYELSGQIAAVHGPIATWEHDAESMTRVLKMHADASKKLDAGDDAFTATVKAARKSWAAAVKSSVQGAGIRNAQASVLAPTGTISFMMDCDTTGVEPDFSLVKQKKLVGGGNMTIVNQTVQRALRRLGYNVKQIRDITDYVSEPIDHNGWVSERNTVVGAPHLDPKYYPIFDCAVGERAIHFSGHLHMMAAVQPFISGAISKTVNLPTEATVDDITATYMEGWKLGLKAVAIYRDGTKVAQPLASKEGAATPVDESGEPVRLWGQRRRMPADRQMIGKRVKIGGVSCLFSVGLFEDGTPGEILINVAKAGSSLRSSLDVLAISAGRSLQYGMPVEELISEFWMMSFEPHGFTDDPEIRNVKSIVDYLARWLARMFLPADTWEQLGINASAETLREIEAEAVDIAPKALGLREKPTAPAAAAATIVKVEAQALNLGTVHGPACGACGGQTIRAGSCYACTDCGGTTGCG